MLTKFLQLTLLASLLTATPALAERFHLRALVIGHMVGMGAQGVLAANDSVQQPMTFELVELENGLVALRDTVTERFVRVGVGQYDYLRADSDVLGAAEIFETQRRGSDLRLRSMRTGQFVGYNVRSGRLRGVFRADQAHSLFTVIPVHEGRPRDDAPAPSQDLPFAGAWRLSAVSGPNGGTITLAREALHGAQLNISRTGGFSGSDGCNQINGVIAPQGAAMRFGEIMSTRRLCHGDAGRVARAMGDAFQNAALFEVSESGHAMRILDANERELLRFSRR